MKVTEPGLNTLIDNLNTLICEGQPAHAQGARTLVLAVAAIGAMKARVGMKKSAIPASSKPKEEKQVPVPDPRFPNARQAWVAEEETLLLDALNGVPNDDIGKHLFLAFRETGENAVQRRLQNRITKTSDEWLERAVQGSFG
ncbi:DNA-binding protein [Klebsiella variicola subsp. variicola]|nr:DNA-binding protein [Klebsiella variicola subsp. variicola]